MHATGLRTGPLDVRAKSGAEVDLIISDSTLCAVGQETHAHRTLHPGNLCSCRMAHLIENGPYSDLGRHVIGCHQTDDASFWCVQARSRLHCNMQLKLDEATTSTRGRPRQTCSKRSIEDGGQVVGLVASGNHWCCQICHGHGLELCILDVVPRSDLPPGTLQRAEYMGSGVLASPMHYTDCQGPLLCERGQRFLPAVRQKPACG